MSDSTAPMLGIPLNPFAPAPALAFLKAAEQLGIPHRQVDMSSLKPASLGDHPADNLGAIEITHITPVLLYGYPLACLALRQIQLARVRSLNPIQSVALADDKALSAVYLQASGVAQPDTVLLNPCDLALASSLGYPLWLKRPHGSLGFWVRRVTESSQLQPMAEELLTEGAELLVAQAEVTESLGTAIRVIVLNGQVLASTIRTAADGEFLSNVAAGGKQAPVELTEQERAVAIDASAALALGFSGVDIMRSQKGPVVLEINANPGFTSMTSHINVDIAQQVLKTLLARNT